MSYLNFVLQCPICKSPSRSKRTLWNHIESHTEEELIEWGKTEFNLSEEEVTTLQVNWKSKVFKWLMKKYGLENPYNRREVEG